MKKILLSLLGALTLGVTVLAIVMTRDGTLETPVGEGLVAIGDTSFEAFPLPENITDVLREDIKSYLVEVAPGIKIHVLETGSGYPVYMQHGLPTSGLLYRDVGANLPPDQFRVIMPTMVGLGFSSKVPASAHSVKNHFAWMATLLAKLELSELIFVGHDWGGPIGAGAVSRSDDVLKGMVVLNTVLDAPTEPRPVPTILKLVRTPVLGEIMLEGILSVFDQLPSYQNDPASMPPEVIALYADPVNNSGNAKGPLAIARMAVFDPDHPDAAYLQEAEDFLRANPVPTEIVWGMNDARLGSRLTNMQAVLPHAEVVETQAGHFVQEEAPEAIAAAIERVLAKIRQ